MRTILIGTIILTVASQCSRENPQTSAVTAQSAAIEQQVRFYRVAELSPPPGLTPSLRGARPAVPADWPASFYSTHAGGSCTSTFIGERVMLTAAHCVADSGTAAVRVGEVVRTGVCSRAPDYPANPKADWALCVFSERVIPGPYERVNTDASLITAKSQLLLTGFGCTTNTGTGGNDGIFRIGEAIITGVPTLQSFDIETNGKVALCFGDSGGGAYLYLDAAKKKRVQVSVNSRVGKDPVTETLTEASYLSSLTVPAAKTFISEWSRRHRVLVCGIDQSAGGCR